jgi:biopolymer transport protein ExbD
VQIRADKGTEYQVIQTVMGDAKNAGIAKLGFITQAHGKGDGG